MSWLLSWGRVEQNITILMHVSLKKVHNVFFINHIYLITLLKQLETTSIVLVCIILPITKSCLLFHLKTWDAVGRNKVSRNSFKVELTLNIHGFLNMPLSCARRESNGDTAWFQFWGKQRPHWCSLFPAKFWAAPHPVGSTWKGWRTSKIVKIWIFILNSTNIENTDFFCWQT